MARDEEVLRRRARFVATALVLSGCGREKSVEPLPTKEVKPLPSSAPASPEPVPPPTERPSLGATVSPAAKADHDALLQDLDALHVAVKKTAASPPTSCDLAEADCVARVRKYVLAIADHRDAIPEHPRCPPKGADAIALEALRAAHASWFASWLAAMDKRLDALYAGSADAGGTLGALRNEGWLAHPKPCLKYSCP